MIKNSNVGSVNSLTWNTFQGIIQTNPLQGLFSKMDHASTEEMTNARPNRTLKCVIETQTDNILRTNNAQLNVSHDK